MPPSSDLPAALAPDDVFLRLQTALAGEYSIERELGRGGMGIVYLAREVRLARQVAIKVLPPSLATPDRREQFVREAQTAAGLSHPNIVAIHRVDEAGGFVYFVMAFLDGETLAQRIRARGPLPPHVAARVLREVSWALTYAHSNGIVHRDIKADNIMLERGTDRAIVMDFGIAGAAHADARAADGQIAGSAHYASPEQIAGQPLDAASDLYSLGVVGYLALTGRLPFDAPTSREVVAMQLNALPASITAIAPTVPAKLAQAVERCLAKRAEHRYAGAATFAEVLESAIEPPREIPAPLRVWIKNSNQHFRIQIVASIYLTAGAAIPLAVTTQSPLLGLVIAGTAVLGVGVLPSLIRTKRLLDAGYGIHDIRVALREYWARRREEDYYELAGAAGGLRGPKFWRLFGTSTALAITFGALGMLAPRAFWPMLPVLTTLATVVAAGAGIFRLSEWTRLRALPRLGSSQLKFYNGKWGERFLKLAGLGAKKPSTAATVSQLTEVALGRATDALYDALPKAVRKQLKALPDVVRRLEDDATKLRAEIDRLDASIADLDRDMRTPLPESLVAERQQVRTDLAYARERLAGKLAATVAALENIRLDLLRLQLGEGRVESVTATLDAAQSLGAELTAYADAQREVDDTLARRSSLAARPE
jgi:serine/threonine-protein kinase